MLYSVNFIDGTSIYTLFKIFTFWLASSASLSSIPLHPQWMAPICVLVAAIVNGILHLHGSL